MPDSPHHSGIHSGMSVIKAEFHKKFFYKS